MNAWRTDTMTERELTEMVLRVMRQQLEEKMHMVARPRPEPRGDQRRE